MHVTAKPSSFQCNLKCDYCFYLEKESQFTHEKWMDDSTLKEFIKQYIAASGNQVYFTWQGGEPTLAGLDFFRKVIHYQQRYAGQKRIFNALQTNGILSKNMSFWLVSRSMDPRSYMTVTDAVIQVTVLLQK